MDKDHKILNSEKGVSLIITFFIMILLLAVVLSVSVILYGEIKVTRNMSNSMVSLYGAESGIEKVLYYDRQVLPVLSVSNSCTTNANCTSPYVCNTNTGVCTQFATRGLCTIFTPLNNPNYCQASGSSIDKSIYCTQFPSKIYNDLTNIYFYQNGYNASGCDPASCNDCQISFQTTFDNRTYTTTAEVYPFVTYHNSSVFQVDSKGTFAGAQRQVEIAIFPTH